MIFNSSNKIVVVATKDRTYSPFIPNTIEDSYYGVADGLNNLADAIHSVAYWFSPINLWKELGELINHPETPNVMISGTIIALFFIIMGAPKIKKFTAFTLLAYFLLRGLVFI